MNQDTSQSGKKSKSRFLYWVIGTFVSGFLISVGTETGRTIYNKAWNSIIPEVVREYVLKNSIFEYDIRLYNFSDLESRTIIAVMSDEFPKFQNVELVRSNNVEKVYSYRSMAKLHKMDEWIFILLRDMGFFIPDDVSIEVEGMQIRILKNRDTPDRKISNDERSRYGD